MLRLFRLPGIFCLLATTLCFAQPQGGQTTTIAAPGDRTPDGDHIDFPDQFAIGEAGSVFSAQLTDADVLGIFSRLKARETEILRIGDTFTDAGTVTALDDALWMNSQGKVLVSATTIDSNSVTHNALLCGTSTATMQTVALSDETVPDGNGQLDNLVSATLNNRGDVGFWASIKNSQGVSPANAVFIGHADGTITQVARTGQAAPGETNTFFSMGDPAPINLKGQVSFAAEINDSQFGTGNNYGLYRSFAGGLLKLARSYDPAPNTPYLLGFLQVGGMNDNGVTCFYASLITPSGLFKGFGLFKSGNGADVATIAYFGQNVPGGLGQYTAFDSVIDINNAGQTAYTGYFTGATSSGSGIFLGDGITQQPLVVTGQKTRDGSTFTSFGTSRVNDQGLVLFLAQLDNAPGFNAIFVTNGIQTVRVAKVGDIVNGVQIAALGFDSNGLNNRNQVIYEAIDPAGDSRILSFTPRL